MPAPRFARHSASAILLLAALAGAAPALAQYGWGRSGWGRSPFDDGRMLRSSASARDDREGRVDAAHFIADDAGDQLGHGPIAVTTMPGTTEPARASADYEAAMIDQLVKAGYDTMKPDPQGGQVAQIRIVRDVLVPQEDKRKPVSGEVTMGASNRGTMMGMAVAVDLSKPRKALVSTRMEAQIIDRASGKALWEGRAEIATREGDDKWTDQAIANRLAAAMFDRFPTRVAANTDARQP